MTNYEKILLRLEKKLIKLIAEMINKGKSQAQIIAAVNDFIRRFNPYKRLSDKFLADAEVISDTVYKEVQNKFNLKVSRTRPKLSKKAMRVLLVTNNQFALMQNSINQNVVNAVKKALKDDLKATELSELIQKSVRGGRYQADTIANTSLQGFSAANRIDQERAAGVKLWKYVGPPPNRPFCSEHYGKTYTYEQISAMDNKQGLPVLYYGGGWNCPHLWEAVITPDLIRRAA